MRRTPWSISRIGSVREHDAAGGQEEVRLVESTVAVQLARQGEGGGDVGGSRAQEADADAGGDVCGRGDPREPAQDRASAWDDADGNLGGGALGGDGFGGRRRRGADAGTRETTARDMMTIAPRRDRGCADRRARATGSARRSSRPTKSSTTPSALAALDDRRSRDPAAGCPFTKSLARGDAMSQQFESACLIHDRTVTLLKSACERFSRRWESARRVPLMRRPTRTSVASAGSRAHDRARLGDVPAPPATTFARVRRHGGDRAFPVKPDAVRGGLTERILSAAESDGFYVVRRAEKRLTPARARELYAHLEGTPAFRATAEFMCGGPVVVAVLSKVDAVASWRERIGPADPNVARETHPSPSAAQLGVDSLRNVVHGSATVKDAAREKALLFPSGPLPPLVPKEYLLETLVMPARRGARRDVRRATRGPVPLDVALVSHQRPSRRGRQRGVAHPDPLPTDALERAAGAECHRHVLGAPLYDATWNFPDAKTAIPLYGVTARARRPARSPSRRAFTRAAIKISRGCSSRTNRWCTSGRSRVCDSAIRSPAIRV